MRVLPPALVFGLLLTACSGPALRLPPDSRGYGADFEKRVFIGLREVQASDRQRDAVLAALDATDPGLKAIGREMKRLRKDWHGLDPHAADYRARADVIASQEGQLAAKRLSLRAEFNRRVAASLDGKQWRKWNTLFNIGSPDAGGDPSDFDAGRDYAFDAPGEL